MLRTHSIARPHHSAFRGWIGIARIDITPPVGIYSRNWGAAKGDVAESIHRPLTLTAMTLATSSEADPLVLIDADLGWWKTPGAFTRFRENFLRETGIESSRWIFALTHTHAGPPLMDPDPSFAGSEHHRPWMEKVFRAAVDATALARKNASEGLLEWHHGRCGLACERDLKDPHEPHSRIVCGYNPEGLADDTLLIGRVSSLQGEQRATLVHYACHPTTLAWENRAISPDFIGSMRETIEREVGGLALFLQGASGELSPREQYVGDPSIADRHGRQLGYAALATLHDMETPGKFLSYERTVESGAPLAVWSENPFDASQTLRAVETTIELPLKDWPSAEALEQERLRCTDRALEERLRRKRDIRRSLGDGSTFELPVWTWQIGDALLVGNCGEAYSILQRELRREFSGRAIVCMNLVNGSIGYLPPAAYYDRDIYQVWQTPFDRGSLERVLEGMRRSIGSLLAESSNSRS